MSHITIPSNVSNSAEYYSDGSSNYSIPFPFFETSDIVVTVDGVRAYTGFTVTGYVARDGGFDGGFLDFAQEPVAGAVVRLVRLLEIGRTTDFPYPSRTLDIRALNTQIDRIIAMLQDASRRDQQAVRAPVDEVLTPMPKASLRANLLLGFDGVGQPALYPKPNLNLLQDYLVLPSSAVPGGTALDALRIQAAMDAAQLSGGGLVRLSPAPFFLDRKLDIPPNVELHGAGRFNTTLIAQASLVGDVIDMGVATVMTGLTLSTDGTYFRQSGAMVRMRGNAAILEAFQMQFYHVGVVAEGTLNPDGSANVLVRPRVADGLMRLPSTRQDATAIIGHHFSNIDLTSLVITGDANGPQASAGIFLRNGDTAILSDLNVTGHGCALTCSPQAGEHLFALHCANSLFDSAKNVPAGGLVNAANLAPGAGGRIINAGFANCWFGLSSGNGLAIYAPASLGCRTEGVVITGTQFMGNGEHGLVVSGPGAANIAITGSNLAGNTLDGANFNDQAGRFTMVGNRSGQMDVRGPNRCGIQVEANAGDAYAIIGNTVVGNTVAGLLDNRNAPNSQVANNVQP